MAALVDGERLKPRRVPSDVGAPDHGSGVERPIRVGAEHEPLAPPNPEPLLDQLIAYIEVGAEEARVSTDQAGQVSFFSSPT